jgi:hypothetical protein
MIKSVSFQGCKDSPKYTNYKIHIGGIQDSSLLTGLNSEQITTNSKEYGNCGPWKVTFQAQQVASRICLNLNLLKQQNAQRNVCRFSLPVTLTVELRVGAGHRGQAQATTVGLG